MRRHNARRASWPACPARARTRRSATSPTPSRAAPPRSSPRTPRTCAWRARTGCPTRSSIACCSTRTACTTWPRACAPWRRCPTRSDSSSTAGVSTNGIELRKVRVPLGVVAVIYEARPNVTVDAACLCLKTGNAVILRGGSAAMHSNRILSEVVQGAVIEAGLPREAVSYLTPDRRELDELLEQRRYVDLVIPRGGEELKDYLMERSKVPVIYAAGGNCHVYVDAAADLDKAVPIIVNAKCQRPGVCNAAETLLVHRDVAAELLPRAVDELQAARRRAGGRQGRRRRARRSVAEARQQDALRDGVPGAQARRARRRLPRRGPGAHRHLRHAPLRGDRHRRPRRRPTVHGRGRRRLRVRERVDALHRRRRSSGWAPRWASPRRSCTRAAPSLCRSSPASSTSCGATGRCAPSAVHEARPRLGVIGGSFDPPHLGHLVIASEAHARLGLERVALRTGRRAAAQGSSTSTRRPTSASR